MFIQTNQNYAFPINFETFKQQEHYLLLIVYAIYLLLSVSICLLYSIYFSYPKIRTKIFFKNITTANVERPGKQNVANTEKIPKMQYSRDSSTESVEVGSNFENQDVTELKSFSEMKGLRAELVDTEAAFESEKYFSHLIYYLNLKCF